MSFQDNWREEKRSSYLYDILAKHEPSIIRKQMFKELALAAEKQATLWEAQLHQRGLPIPLFRPNVRLKIVSILIPVIGVHRLRRLLSTMKIRGMSALGSDHHEHQHIAYSTANNLRAAIFGVNDGLISNMSLLLGMVGAHANLHTLLIAGTAGLLAGAASMGAGEYISVRSQREVFEYQIDIERQELAEYPEEEKQELSLIYQARGLNKDHAEQLASIMIQNPAIGLDTLAREELGLNPEDIGSPVGAMLYSFFSFMIGAFIPLLPFIFIPTASTIWISMLATCGSLFLIGLILSLLSNQTAWWSGIRMLLVGTLAGSITYSIGHVLDIAMR